MVYNGDFEGTITAGVPEDWIKLGDVRAKCNNPGKTNATIFGNCGMIMRSINVPTSTIKQVIDLPRGIWDDSLLLSAQVKAKALTFGRLVLKIVYANGSKANIKFSLHEPDVTYGWTLKAASPFVLNDTVVKMVLVAQVKQGGKYQLDDLSLELDPTPVDND